MNKKTHHFRIGIAFQDGTVANFRHNEFNPIRGYMSIQDRVASILDNDLRVSKSVVVAPFMDHEKSRRNHRIIRFVATPVTASDHPGYVNVREEGQVSKWFHEEGYWGFEWEGKSCGRMTLADFAFYVEDFLTRAAYHKKTYPTPTIPRKIGSSWADCEE